MDQLYVFATARGRDQTGTSCWGCPQFLVMAIGGRSSPKARTHVYPVPQRVITQSMIGRLESVVLDTRDPSRLARFYVDLLGAKVTTEEKDWITIVDGDGRKVSFQTSPEHVPPMFPDPAGSQQLHLDIRVGDIEEAEREVLALGAIRATGAHEDNTFRVFRDPDGHPFCLVWD